MRITLGLFGYEVFSFTVNDPNEAAYAAGLELADDEEPEAPADDESWQGGMHFYGAVESTMVEANSGSTWEDRGSLHQFDPGEDGEDRRAGFTRTP